MMVVWLVIVGALAGFIATKVMRLEASLVTTLAIGIAGAVVGGFLLRLVYTLLGMFGGVLAAVAGAILLIWLWNTYGKG